LTSIYWFMAAALALLALGGEGVIRGGVTMTRALGLSPVVIGLFALSLGTASPVLAVAVQADIAGADGMAAGVVIGATLINLLLILGLGALIAPMPSAPKVVLRDGGALLLASGVLVLFALQGGIGRREGVFLLGGFVIYAIVAVVSDWRRPSEHSVACAEAEKRSMGERPSGGGGLFALLVGAICLVLGAHFLTGGSLVLASVWHVPVETLALTGVALVVSLPVLFITAVAALRGLTHIAIGHLITASVFNLCGVLGIVALVRPVTLPPLLLPDVFVMLGASVLLLPLLSTSWTLSRMKGALLLLVYVGYVGFVAWRQGLLPHFA
jgi:cation:H+ antiporter